MIPPTMSQLLDTLADQELVVGLLLVGAGLVYMVMGVRIVKTLVAISFGVVGFGLGVSLPVPPLAQWFCGLVAAVALAMVSTLVLKLAVAVLAGGWSGLTIMGLASGLGASNVLAAVCGILACGVAISMTCIMFNEVVAFVTSLQGSLLFLAGLVVFLGQSPLLWGPIKALLMENALLGVFLVFAGTVTGFYLQIAQLRQREFRGPG